MDRINRAVRQRRKGQRGFTLIELLVVIAVLAILATIVIFNVTGVTNRGTKSACETDVKSVQTAVDAYVGDNPSADPLKAYVDPQTAGGVMPDDKGGPTTGIWTKLVPNYIHSEPNVAECTKPAMSLAYANKADATNGYSVNGDG